MLRCELCGKPICEGQEMVRTLDDVYLHRACVQVEAVAPGRPAYRVEVDHDGCSYCQRGREYTVVGPDGVAIGESFEDREQADDIAELMNLAFEAGKAARAQEA